MKPRCPECGSEDVAQIDMVEASYQVVEIRPDGSYDSGVEGGEVGWDSAVFAGFGCRACDYRSAASADFYPWASEVERGEALIGSEVQGLDGDVFVVERVSAVDGKAYVHGTTTLGRAFLARPHEVRRWFS